MVEKGIAQLLAANEGVQALIGTTPVRLYEVLVPDDPGYPCASYQVISDVPSYTLDGRSLLRSMRLQIDTRSNVSPAAAKAVRDVIRNILESFVGVLPNGTRVAGIFVANTQDFYEPDARCYRTSTDYKIQFYP